MSRSPTALVTGGAGLIGSHVADLALADGWQVRILDNLDQQSHRHSKPEWIPTDADFMLGDVRRRSDWERALDGVDIVFHEAAYGGNMPDVAKMLQVNDYGTALMLETIRDRHLPVRKIVFASSHAVYNEGTYCCPWHGPFYGSPRPVSQLAKSDFDVHCPNCQASASPIPTDERAPIGGEHVYAISKATQERLILCWGRATGMPVVALRYSCTYGPRQSLFNPNNGVIAVFCARLLNELPPIVYEDGRQMRDLIYVEDVARATLLAAMDERADGQVFNVGTGQAVAVSDLARLLARQLQTPIEPIISGEFRLGETRALITDNSRLATLGFKVETDLVTGIGRYLDWIKAQGTITDHFSRAETSRRRHHIVEQAYAVGVGFGV